MHQGLLARSGRAKYETRFGFEVRYDRQTRDLAASKAPRVGGSAGINRARQFLAALPPDPHDSSRGLAVFQGI